MTDLIARPESASGDDATPTVTMGAQTPPPVEWAPHDDEPRKKKHLGWWIGVPSALVVAGVGVCCAILIAPGTTAAGTPIGFSTTDAAASSIAANLASTQVTIAGENGGVTLSAADLGVTIDANAIAQSAHAERPLWNVSQWNAGAIDAPIQVDQDQALAALTERAPDLFSEAVSSQVSFDQNSGSFAASEATPGIGVDVETLVGALTTALQNGARDITVEANPTEVAPTVSQEAGQAEADSLNQLIHDAGFFVGDDLAVDIDPATLASWMTVTEQDGQFSVDVDEAAMGDFVASIPEQVNREAVTAEVVTNSAGDALREINPGQDGWQVTNVDGIAGDFAAAIESGNAHYELPVETVEHEVNELFRRIEVNKAAGTATLFENEQVVASYPIAVGKPGWESDSGNFTVRAQVQMQDMGCVPGYDYCTEDVKWVTYYNGDEAFHGTYWHNNFGPGAAMSHGCINMTEDAALFTYRFAQIGTEVSVF